jgi:hypothetical protein
VNPLLVRCRFCGSSVGEPCGLRDGSDRGAVRKQLLRISRAHPSRIEDAARAAGASEDEAKKLVLAEQVALVARYRSTVGSSPEGEESSDVSS